MPRINPPPAATRARRKIPVESPQTVVESPAGESESLIDVDAEVKQPMQNDLNQFDPINNKESLNPFRTKLYISQQEMKYEPFKQYSSHDSTRDSTVGSGIINDDTTELSCQLRSDVTIGSILDRLDHSSNPFMLDSFVKDSAATDSTTNIGDSTNLCTSDPTSLNSNDSGMLSGSTTDNQHHRGVVPSSAL